MRCDGARTGPRMNREPIRPSIHPATRTLMNRSRVLLSVRSANLQRIASTMLVIRLILTADHRLNAGRHDSLVHGRPAEVTRIESAVLLFLHGESSGIG